MITIPEVITLWILCTAVTGFFVGFKSVLKSHILIALLVVAGFIMEFGAYIFHALLKI